MAIRTYPAAATAIFHGLPDRNPGTPHRLSCIRKVAMPHPASPSESASHAKLTPLTGRHQGPPYVQLPQKANQPLAGCSQGTATAR
jgi:hypothetical protein